MDNEEMEVAEQSYDRGNISSEELLLFGSGDTQREQSYDRGKISSEELNNYETL